MEVLTESMPSSYNVVLDENDMYNCKHILWSLFNNIPMYFGLWYYQWYKTILQLIWLNLNKWHFFVSSMFFSWETAAGEFGIFYANHRFLVNIFYKPEHVFVCAKLVLKLCFVNLILSQLDLTKTCVHIRPYSSDLKCADNFSRYFYSLKLWCYI